MFLRLILVHVGVGQRCRALDEESPAMLPTKSTSNLPLWMKYRRRFEMQTLTLYAKITRTRTATGQSNGQFKGVMYEMSQKVQKVSTHILPCSGTHLS